MADVLGSLLGKGQWGKWNLSPYSSPFPHGDIEAGWRGDLARITEQAQSQHMLSVGWALM